jgi:hypothetical protein
MRDLVEPRSGVLRLLQRVVVLVGLDERVLGQIRGEFRFAEHADEIGIDLVVMLGEERLDEYAGLLMIPCTTHDAHTRSEGCGAAERAAKASECGIGDHRFSGRDIAGNAANRGHALNGPKTTGKRVM